MRFLRCTARSRATMWRCALSRQARRRGAHRPHHQRRPCSLLARPADVPPLRSPPRRGLAASTAARRAPGKGSRTSTTASCGRRTSASNRSCSTLCAIAPSSRPKRRGEPDETLQRLGKVLSPDALTIGFARRFATYKRANLILADMERLAVHGERSQAPGAVRLRRQGASARRAGQARPAADRRR